MSKVKLALARKKLRDVQNSLSMSVQPRKVTMWTAQVEHWTKKVKELENAVHSLPGLAYHEPTDKAAKSAPEILEAALKHMQDRAVTYDNPEGERSIPNVVAMFNIATGRDLTPEEGWLFQVLLKIVRANQGDFKLDNFEDMVAYAALYGEEAANGTN